MIKMARSIGIAKDGKLALLESDVERTITDFLAAEGWLIFPTKAEARMPSGAPVHMKGTLDLLAVRSREVQVFTNRRGVEVPGKRYDWKDVLFIEAKRKYACTEKRHLAEQVAMAAWLTEKGFPVCRIPEGWADPVGYFMTYYRENFE